MHYVTKEKTPDGHFMVKVAGRSVTETHEKRKAKKLVRALCILRRLKKDKESLIAS